MYLLRTLGELSLTRADGTDGSQGLSSSKALLILAWLATRPNRAARRDALAEVLWPGADRSKALRALRQALFYLSQHADDLLIRDDDSLRLDLDRIKVDLWEFDAAIRAGDYARALELYHGPFVAGLERKVGVEAEHWIEEENSRLQVAVEVAYSKRIGEALIAGEHAEAERLARAFAAMNPLDDSRQVTLVRTLKAAGDELGALRAFDAYRQVVRQELGDEPPAELAATMERLRAELTAPPPEAIPAAAGPVSDAGGGPPPLDRRRAGRELVFAAALIAIAILTATIVLSRRPPIGPEFVAGMDATLLAASGRPGEPVPVEVVVREGAIQVRPSGFSSTYALPAPGGDRIAYAERAPTGWNLAVRDGRGAGRVVTTMEGDEYPLTWSPDGQYLVFAHRRLRDDGTPSHRLYVLDFSGDTTRPLSTLETRERPGAAWSPDGTQVAFTADVEGSPDIFVVDFDGANLRNLTRHPAPDSDPAWAPDRSRIAFVSRRREDANLYSIRPDGSDLRELTQLTENESSPVWISPSALLFLAGGEEPEVWALDMATPRAFRLAPAVGFHRLVMTRDATPGWIDQVRIQPRHSLTSPGQHVALQVEALDRSGSATSFARLPLRWLVEDSAVARVEDGLLRFLAPGSTTLHLSAGGWRSDTLSLVVVPLVEVEVAPAFSETWTSGLAPDRWRLYGEPPPKVATSGGPEAGGMLINPGDAFFESGVITQEPISLGDGLTVEVEGRIRFTGKVHQEFAIALLADAAPDSALASGSATPIVAVRFRGPSDQEPREATVATRDEQVTFPMPAALSGWRHIAVQLRPGGPIQVLLDGRLHWESPGNLPRRLPGQGWLALGLRSYETDIAHGPVRVYPGLKYRVPSISNP